MKQVILPKNVESVLWNVCAEMLNQDDIIVRLEWHIVAEQLHDTHYIDEYWTSGTKKGTISRLCGLLNDLGCPTNFSITKKMEK